MPGTLTAPASRTRPRPDLDLLQGAWKTIAGRREARLLIAGTRFAFEFLDGDGGIYIGTFALNGDGSPAGMDMKIEEGPGDHKGQPALCIYHLDSDILRWCPARPGAATRLSRFPSVDDEKYLSLVFKHVKPPRKTPDGV